MMTKLKKSYLDYTRDITPRIVKSCEVQLRGLAPGLTQLRRNDTALASRWRHCVKFKRSRNQTPDLRFNNDIFSPYTNLSDVRREQKLKHPLFFQPDIRRYLRQFVTKVTQASYDEGFNRHHDSMTRPLLEERAEDAIEPLMTYLKSNLETLHAWLCEVGCSCL